MTYNTWFVFLKIEDLQPILVTPCFKTLDQFLLQNSFQESQTISYLLIKKDIPHTIKSLYTTEPPNNLEVVVGYTNTETSVYTLYIMNLPLKVSVSLNNTDNLVSYIPKRDHKVVQGKSPSYSYLVLAMFIVVLLCLFFPNKQEDSSKEIYIKSNSLGCSQFKYKGDLFWRCPPQIDITSITTVVKPPGRSSYEETHPVVKE